nr:retrovirus-related Pol polyprotein from transposon TNT 1-94 [Tanacetum cinerariifolium]
MSNTLHNAIMEAGSKDRPPMLAPGNYVQWKSRIKRYIDTKPNHELIHYCLTNPPYELGWKEKFVLDSEGNPTTTIERQFWTSVLVKKVNDVTRLQALVDKKKVIITEATIRDALRLNDAKGIDCLCAKLPKQFRGEAVNTACYTQNKSIIVKRLRKIAYDVFRGKYLDIIYFCVFGCLVHIHNHKDHLGKFDDGFFLDYSPVAKAFRVFNIIRQEMEETIHVTFSEDDEAISQSSIEGDAINFNENRSLPDDEFLEPRSKVTQCPEPPEFTIIDDHRALNELDQLESADNLEPAEIQDNDQMNQSVMFKPLQPFNPQMKVSLILVVRDSKATSAYECLYVNFIFEMEPKKLIEALEEEGWIIAMQEELNQFERNKVWTLVPKPHGKTIIGTKWVWKNKLDENGVVIKNKAMLIAQGYNQQEGIEYEETFAPVARLEAIRIFLAYAAYMGFYGVSDGCEKYILNWKISKEVYVQQPHGFESSYFPNHVCKLDKALYRLKQAPIAWYETLSKFLIRNKFVRGPDDSGVSVNETLFRGMIRSLVYLTASRTDI